MKDKEARDRIREIESRLLMLEDDEVFRIITDVESASPLYLYLSRPFHKIRSKEVIEAILKHLELGLGVQSATKSKVILTKLEDTND